jgi:hypothetical protein
MPRFINKLNNTAMKTKIKIVLFVIGFLSWNAIESQTVVKMDLPPQAKEPLSVVVLFDEEVPEGMPVVLGLMGYKVTGGIFPYTFEWLQNGVVVGNGDVVVITPAKGDRFELKATDKNRCYSTTSFSMKVISRFKNQNDDEYKIFPTIVTQGEINVVIPELANPLTANVRIFDLKGVLHHQTEIAGSTTISFNIPDGTYFVSVQTDAFHKVEKIIIQH